MAKLKPCSTCQKEIASSAPTCPHCGAANKAPKKSIGTGTGIIIIIALIWGFNSLKEANKPKAPPETAQQKTQRLERELKAIPEEQYQKNFERYQQLLQLHPNNEKYQQRVKFYKPKAMREKEIVKQFSAWDGSHTQFERMIKNVLKDPDSYEHIETKYIDKEQHIIVITKYRARNSFGGYVVESKAAKFSIDGQFLTEITL